VYAVFFMSESMEFPGIEDGQIHLFADEHDAQKFVFDTLVAAGFIEVRDGEWSVGGVAVETMAAGIDEVHEGFDLLEFFHVYPVVNHCEDASLA